MILQIESNDNRKIYLPMNEGSDGASANGDTVWDMSDNRNNGTMSGGVWKAESHLSYPMPQTF